MLVLRRLGVARRYVARADGHRQIVDLLLPGDFAALPPAMNMTAQWTR
jgi:hypothetical protein